MSEVFDFDQLESITGGDAEFEREVLEEFLATAPQDLDRLRAGITQGDAAAVGAAAHALKGASATIGGRGFAAIALELEKAGKQGSLDDSAAALTRLEAAYEGLTTILRQRIARAA